MEHLSYPELKENFALGSYMHHRRDPFTYYKNLHRDHGKTVKFRLVNLNAISIVDKEDVKYVLQTNFNNYQRSRGHDILELLIGKGLINLEGPRWKEQRRHFQKHFSIPHIEENKDAFSEIIDQRFKLWNKQFVEQQYFDISKECTKLAQLFGAKVLFGFDLEPNIEIFNSKFQDCIDHIGARIHRGRLPIQVPTPENIKFKKSRSFLEQMIFDNLDEQLKNKGKISGMLSEALDGLLKSDLESNDLAKLFRDQVMTFMTAASDTTSTVLSWGFYELSKRPEVQEALYNEIKDLNTEDFLTSKNCPLLDSFWNETLRMYPSVWGMSRTVEEDDVIGNYPVKAGEEIFILPYVIHRHPDYWDQPDEFIFDRFTKIKRPHPYVFIPFGGGPRICIGMHMVSFQSRLLFAKVLKNYKIKSKDNYTVEPLPLEIALKPKGGVDIYLVNR